MSTFGLIGAVAPPIGDLTASDGRQNQCHAANVTDDWSHGQSLPGIRQLDVLRPPGRAPAGQRYLAKAGFIPSGMELFPATDQQQLDFIKKVIDRCDYYVVIVAGRYGSLADDQMSYTEKEYEYALGKKLPVLAFLHRDPAKIEVGKTEPDKKMRARLVAFRKRLGASRIVDHWTDPQDLCTKVLTAVTHAVNLTPAVGWVRGDQAIDPRILQEAERLRMENASLRSRLEALEGGQITFPPDIAGPYHLLDFQIEILKVQGPSGNQTVLETKKELVQITLSDILIGLSESLFEERDLYYIRSDLGRLFLVKLDKDPSTYRARFDDYPVLWRIRIQAEALGLLTTQVKQTRERDRDRDKVVWALTPKGRVFVSHALALPASSD
jgi:Domain of unknown function (DUF4062)